MDHLYSDYQFLEDHKPGHQKTSGNGKYSGVAAIYLNTWVRQSLHFSRVPDTSIRAWGYQDLLDTLLTQNDSSSFSSCPKFRKRES
jgi:hypothetical protein